MWRYPVVFVLMLVAVALVAPPAPSVHNGAPNEHRAAEVARSGQPVTLVANAPEPDLYKMPCKGTGEDRQSDLCAQWKAVDWTKWGVLVGILGTIALVYQIMLTRAALEDTGKATKAMERQNELTEREQRAWIDISLNVLKIVTSNDAVLEFDFEVTFKNIGKSVAESVQTYGLSNGFDEGFREKVREKFNVWWTQQSGKPGVALMPGEDISVRTGHIMAKADLPWMGSKPKRYVNLIVYAAAHYNILGIEGAAGRRRTDRSFRVGLSNDVKLFELYVFENDLRTAEGKDIRVAKVGAPHTT